MRWNYENFILKWGENLLASRKSLELEEDSDIKVLVIVEMVIIEVFVYKIYRLFRLKHFKWFQLVFNMYTIFI